MESVQSVPVPNFWIFVLWMCGPGCVLGFVVETTARIAWGRQNKIYEWSWCPQWALVTSGFWLFAPDIDLLGAALAGLINMLGMCGGTGLALQLEPFTSKLWARFKWQLYWTFLFSVVYGALPMTMLVLYKTSGPIAAAVVFCGGIVPNILTGLQIHASYRKQGGQ